MSALETNFNTAAEKARNFSKKPSDSDMLMLYGLFKQATIGDNNTDRPGILKMTDRAKWDAWHKNEGMTKEEAMEEYIKLVEKLSADHS